MTPCLTAKEAVAYLGLPSVRALYRRIERGTVPAWCYARLGKSYRFSRAALDQLLTPQVRPNQLVAVHDRRMAQPCARRTRKSVAVKGVA